MRKKEYEEPFMELIPYAEDVITASSDPGVIDIPGGGGADMEDDGKW